MPSDSIIKISTRTAVILLLFTLAFTTLMAATYKVTKQTIDANTEEDKLKLIGEVLPISAYDNKLLQDAIEIPAMPLLGLDTPSQIYRARRAGKPVAMVLEAVAPDGYSGRIGLLIAVRASGEIAAVRIVQHKETPGLGDYIDIHKDKNKSKPWITQFEGVGLEQVPRAEWKVKKDGGRFDQRAGATISARAVTNAIGRALQFVAENRERIYAAPAHSKLPVAQPAQPRP